MPVEDDDPEPLPPDDPTQLMTPPTGGGALLPSSPAPTGEVIGDYEVLAKLGAGGMGAVYRARQRSLARVVALKILPAHLIADAESVTRFQREARVAASLSHPNLVRIFTAGEADGVHFIAMELIEGEDLGRRLKTRGRLFPGEALRITREVARGLEYGWASAQLIHRDIKPANIFLAADGAVKVGDLGLAKSVDSHTTGLTQTGTLMGTPHYISPEQARGDKALDFRADIYSLGCTLYQMLTGQVPYAGTDALTIMNQHVNAPLPAILKVWPQCPIPLGRLVSRMLKKSRHERPASYAELIAQLEAVWAQLDPLGFNPAAFAPPPRPAAADLPPAPAPTPALPPAPRKSRLPFYCGLGALVIGFLIGGVFFLFSKKEPPPLTAAQIRLQQREAEQAAARPAPPVPAAPAAEAWQDVLRLPPDKVRFSRGGERTPEGLRLVGEGSRVHLAFNVRDAALRVRSTFRGEKFNLTLREDGTIGAYTLILRPDGTLSLARYDWATKTQTNLRDFSLVRPLADGQDYQMELRVVGTTLTALFDGEVLGSVTDSTIAKGGGGLVLVASPQPAVFKTLEILDLAAPGGASAAPAAEPWVDVLRDPAKLELPSNAVRTPKGLRLDQGTATVPLRHTPRDGAIRVRFTGGNTHWGLRVRRTDAGSYSVGRGSDLLSVVLNRSDQVSKLNTTLKVFWLPQPLEQGRDYLVELRIVGQTLTVKLDGSILGNVTDEMHKEGQMGVHAWGSPVLIKSLEVLDLTTGKNGEPGGDAAAREARSGAAAAQSATSNAR